VDVPSSASRHVLALGGDMPEELTGTRPRGDDPPLDDAPSPFLDDDADDVSDPDGARPTSGVVVAPPRAPAVPDRSVPDPPGPDRAGPSVIRHARDVGEDHGPGFMTRMVAIALAVLIGVAGGVVALTWLFSRTVDQLNPFDQTIVDRSGKPVLQSLNDLKTYHAASGYYEIVIDQETDVENLPAFLAGERVIFVAAGSVDATVDFSAIGSGSVVTNDDRTAVSIALPAVQLGTAQLDLDRSYVAGHQRGLRERLADAAGTQGGGQNTEDLYRLAEQRLSEAGARTDNLKERARTNTRAMLTSLLNQVGYTQVTVTFADQ
jgi:hypothetical protein